MERITVEHVRETLFTKFNRNPEKLLVFETKNGYYTTVEEVKLKAAIKSLTGLSIIDNYVYLDNPYNGDRLSWRYKGFEHLNTIDDIAKEMNALLVLKNRILMPSRFVQLEMNKLKEQEQDLER